MKSRPSFGKRASSRDNAHPTTDAYATMSNSLRSVIEDPDFTQPIVLYRGGATDVDQDGIEEFQFGPGEEMDAIVTAPDAAPYVVEPRGPEEDTEYAMCVMSERNVTQGDRVVYDGGFGPAPFQVIEPRPTRFDGDEFMWFRLIPDNRGEEAPGDDSPDDGSDDGGDDGGYGTY